MEDKPKGVAKNLRAKSAHAIPVGPLVLAFQESTVAGGWNLTMRGRRRRRYQPLELRRREGRQRWKKGEKFTYDRKSANSI